MQEQTLSWQNYFRDIRKASLSLSHSDWTGRIIQLAKFSLNWNEAILNNSVWEKKTCLLTKSKSGFTNTGNTSGVIQSVSCLK